MPDITAVSASRPPQLAAPTDARLRETAKALEASFLAEMLKSAGFGTPRESFGGGRWGRTVRLFPQASAGRRNGETRRHRPC